MDLLDFCTGDAFDIVISDPKAKELGWTGSVKTWDALDTTFKELKEYKVLPKTK